MASCQYGPRIPEEPMLSGKISVALSLIAGITSLLKKGTYEIRIVNKYISYLLPVESQYVFTQISISRVLATALPPF